MAARARQPFRVYRVGGSVRDELLGRPSGDRDWVVVGATPELMIASGYKPVGNDFPVFLHPETREEYALARTERKHGRGYRGFEFFASPEVTLEDDLARRDLTINAMARDESGGLIDPYGGEADLRAGVLRHVSPAFVEDPLRVLRVARFAARFGFSVAPQTVRLMREIVASNELETLVPERVWQEIARGLSEPHPSRMVAVLRSCAALVRIIPEVDRLYGVRVAISARRTVDAGKHLCDALDWAARHSLPLSARYALLTHDFAMSRDRRDTRAQLRRADAISERLKVPTDCRDAARLVERWQRDVDRIDSLAPAAILDLLQAADALRRPERLSVLLTASQAIACSLPRASQAYPQAAAVNDALRAVRAVDAGAVALATRAERDGGGEETIANAIRAARIDALHRWKRANAR